MSSRLILERRGHDAPVGHLCQNGMGLAHVIPNFQYVKNEWGTPVRCIRYAELQRRPPEVGNDYSQTRSIRSFFTLALLIMSGSQSGAFAPFGTLLFEPEKT